METIPILRLPAEVELVLAEKVPWPKLESPEGRQFCELFADWWLRLREAQNLGVTFVEILSVLPAPFIKKEI